MKNGLDKAQMAQIEFIQALTKMKDDLDDKESSFDKDEG